MTKSIDEDLAQIREAACKNHSEFNPNQTDSYSLFHNGTASLQGFDQGNPNSTSPYFRYLGVLLDTKVSVFICIFGLIGNICNLMVYIPQGRHCSMGRIEKSVYWGLVALAFSDMLFCVMVILRVYIERDELSIRSITFSLVVSVYSEALINIFVLASTWLTIIMAIGRYLAICHPFRAREIIGMTVAKRIVLLIYCLCLLLNAPRFFFYKIEKIECVKVDYVAYFRWPSHVHGRTNPSLQKSYDWFYFIIGIALPCGLLVLCNALLVRALRRARTKLRLIRAIEVSSVDQYRAITMVLVALVLMHIFLVSPAEIVFFIRQQLLDINEFQEMYNLIVTVLNTLQALNFSMNFVLYCVINVHFRRALVRLIKFRWLWFRKPSLFGHVSKMSYRNESVTLTTCVSTGCSARTANAHALQTIEA